MDTNLNEFWELLVIRTACLPPDDAVTDETLMQAEGIRVDPADVERIVTRALAASSNVAKLRLAASSLVDTHEENAGVTLEGLAFRVFPRRDRPEFWTLFVPGFSGSGIHVVIGGVLIELAEPFENGYALLKAADADLLKNPAAILSVSKQ